MARRLFLHVLDPKHHRSRLYLRQTRILTDHHLHIPRDSRGTIGRPHLHLVKCLHHILNLPIQDSNKDSMVSHHSINSSKTNGVNKHSRRPPMDNNNNNLSNMANPTVNNPHIRLMFVPLAPSPRSWFLLLLSFLKSNSSQHDIPCHKYSGLKLIRCDRAARHPVSNMEPHHPKVVIQADLLPCSRSKQVPLRSKDTSNFCRLASKRRASKTFTLPTPPSSIKLRSKPLEKSTRSFRAGA
jgi:hypothetical protein